MEAIHRRDVFEREHDFGAFQGAWLMPKDERRQGVILYLHGGGYTCGSLEYAKGFAATLADECRRARVLRGLPSRAGAPLSRRAGRRAGRHTGIC